MTTRGKAGKQATTKHGGILVSQRAPALVLVLTVATSVLRQVGVDFRGILLLDGVDRIVSLQLRISGVVFLHSHGAQLLCANVAVD